MATFGAKLEHLLSSRAEIISRMHRPPPAEGNDLERLLGLPPGNGPTSSAPPPNIPIWPDEQSAAFCAVTPPIETFMEVPDEIRREQFFATARRDDVIVGVINVIQDSGLVITVLAYDQGPRRDFDGLKLTGFCPLRQLPRYNAHGNALDAFQIGDKVRAFVLDVHGTGRLILSMNPKMLGRDLYGDIKLGLITDDDLPLHYKKLQNLDGKSYEAYLESTPQFRNPDGLQVLCVRMGIPRSSACSLLNCISKIRLPKSEMACELRRTQLLTFSMKHVAQGVKYFKDSRNNEALQCYNFAIEVESTNPDAYVARGALYASIGTYTKAVDDLEKSLELQTNHANAKNYLGQTLVAFAGEIHRKDPPKAEQLLQRALKLDPDNREARDALKELPIGSAPAINRDATSMRSWSRSPSPARAGGRGPMGGGSKRDRSVTPVSGSVARNAAGYASHMERSRAALEQLVEEDRSRRATKDSGGRHGGGGADQSSPGRSYDRRRHGDDIKSNSGSGLEKSNILDRGDLSKIVITRNRSGRIIRCRDEDEYGEMDRGRSDGNWKRHRDDDYGHVHDSKRGRSDADSDGRGNRRIFTPPRNAREGEHGSLTMYENENDLPLSSKSLQERVQARLRAIERRHHLEDGSAPPPAELANGPMQTVEKGREGSVQIAGEDYPRGESPPRGSSYQGNWRGGSGGPGNFERRLSGGGGSFHRQDYYGRGGGGGYFGRGRARGGPRWRGQWDDYRHRRGNWQRFDDRRRADGPPGGGSGAGGGFDRRRRRYGASGSVDRSSRSRTRSKSRTRSRSSRSGRSSSASQSPVRPGARGRVISRARIKTPPLAPLTNAKRSSSDENLAELDQFIAQLRAKRQMEQQFEQQQHLLAQMHGTTTDSDYPGQQLMPPPSTIEPCSAATIAGGETNYDMAEMHAADGAGTRLQVDNGYTNTSGAYNENIDADHSRTDDQEDNEPPEPASPDAGQVQADSPPFPGQNVAAEGITEAS